MIITINEYRELKSNLAHHAFKELTRAGMMADADYGGMLADAVLDLCDLFGTQGHSGYSAQLTLDIFHKLANRKTLTPITSDPDEWEDVSSYSDDLPDTLWQNKRDCSYFSSDKGQTWKSVDESRLLSILEKILS